MQLLDFFVQAKEHCNLGHVLSLWKTLSVALARTTILNDQVAIIHVNDSVSE